MSLTSLLKRNKQLLDLLVTLLNLICFYVIREVVTLAQQLSAQELIEQLKSCILGKKELKEIQKIMYRNGSSRINTNYSSFDEMKFPDGVNFCIKCKNADTVVKNGKRNGRQRYKCKECNATFTATTDTVMLNTRKTSDVWEKFIWCMLQKYSI